MATPSSTVAWESHRQRGLVCYCPWDRKQLDTTEHMHTYTFNITQPFHSFVCRETYTHTHTHTYTYTHTAPLTKSLTFAYRSGMDLKEAEDIKKWQEYTKELYKKCLNDSDNHDGVVMHLEPDILEYKVKWALEASLRTKLVEVMEFQLSCFKS